MIYRMKNFFMPYAWGDKNLIEKHFKYEYKKDEIVAEIWMGAHPLLSSIIIKDNVDTPLIEHIKNNKNLALGKNLSKKYSELPFLFKILSSKKVLSIQVHPSKKQAEEGFELENSQGIKLSNPNRNYKDKNHKPELIIALEKFYALNGFRKKEEIINNFNKAKIFEKETEEFQKSEDGLKTFFEKILFASKKKIKASVENILKLEDDDELNFIHWVKKSNLQHPFDNGVLAPLYLNIVKLEYGEALFVKSQVLHQYLQGIALEIATNSDNVLRSGCTNKHVDKNELLKSLDFKSTELEIIKEKNNLYKSYADEFLLHKYNINDKLELVFNTAQIILIKEGELKINELNGKVGDSFFVDANTNYCIIGKGIVFIAGVNI